MVSGLSGDRVFSKKVGVIIRDVMCEVVIF